MQWCIFLTYLGLQLKILIFKKIIMLLTKSQFGI